MDITTIVGLLMGTILVAVAMGSDIGVFINIPSLMITVGGTVAATLMSFSMEEIKGLSKVMMKAFFFKPADIPDIIAMMLRFALKARRDGILTLESEIENVDDEFITKSLQVAIDGTSPEVMEDLLNTELEYIEKRHALGQEIMKTMASLFPAFGLIGTLIGLVLMLSKMDDPSAIGPGMAVALLTTLYGAIMANLVCIPIANKLKIRSREELLRKEVILAGILSIQSGDNPRIVEQKLMNYLAPNLRKAEKSPGK